ncbi:MAG: 4Fe-4S binding protein [Desulfobacteraceae bacterium]|jgi:electron transport complex protein RnfB|nr:4Fe-4S binding protein [Desulfobacteraceae bacterium]
MNTELYVKLRKHLDKQPAGFPETESGSEIDILKRFYTPEQAKIALKMTNIPEPAVKIAKKLKTDEKTTGESLEKMAKEGLLFRVHTPEAPLYMQPNFIMGIYEWHVNTVDREIAEKADDVYDRLFEKHWQDKKTKQLRVVPVDQSIEHKDMVRGYDMIRDLVRGTGNGPYAAAPCICRVEQLKRGNKVNRPMDTCLTFGMVAQYYIENGIGKELTEDELMEKLTECEKASLVPFSTNSQKIVNMCMCDKDSCQIFRNLRKLEKPAQEVHAAFSATIDTEICNGCKKCTKKCQIDAIVATDVQTGKKAKIHKILPDRCIGCGLCVAVCPQQAISMQPREVLPDVPENALAMNIALSKERGQLQGFVPYGLVKWLLKLKLGKETANKVINM